MRGGGATISDEREQWGPSDTKSIVINYTQAKTFCALLGSGWRLPSHEELINFDKNMKEGPSWPAGLWNNYKWQVKSPFWSSTLFRPNSDNHLLSYLQGKEHSAIPVGVEVSSFLVTCVHEGY